MIRPPVAPSARLVAHAGAVALAGLLGACLWVAALVALITGHKGAAVGLAALALGARAARPGPCPELDKETGR